MYLCNCLDIDQMHSHEKNLKTWKNFYFDVDLTIRCSYSLSRRGGIGPTRKICFERLIKTFVRHFIRCLASFVEMIFITSWRRVGVRLSLCEKGKTVRIYVLQEVTKLPEAGSFAYRQYCPGRLKLRGTNLSMTLVQKFDRLISQYMYFHWLCATRRVRCVH